MGASEWRFATVWNDSLIKFAERPLKARENIWASELGGSFVDRYLKMLGTKPTNPPNNRSLRKFQAGNLWEWLVGFVLIRAGIMKKKQVRAVTKLPGMLEVTGRLDYIAGGSCDWERAEYEVNQLGLPEFLDFATAEIFKALKELYSDATLVEKILEIKSVGSFVFARSKRIKKPNPNHELQNFHYLFGSEYEYGSIVYVSKDDCQLLEYDVYKSAYDIQMNYERDIKIMTDYFVHKELPPKENEIIFDEGAGRFSKNWKVEYSYYLTKLYKWKTPKEYVSVYAPMTQSFNRVFKRCVNGDKMTDANKIVVAQAKKIFPGWDQFVSVARETGVLEIEEEEDDS